jgi:predicted small lipoprotein YifL
MKKLFLRLLIIVTLASSAGCYHAPRTAWTPKKYKKKNMSNHSPKTRH